MRRALPALALALAAACRAPAPQPAAAAPSLAITNVTVVDADHGTLASGRTVVVAGNRIVAVGPPSRTPVPAGVRTLDGGGKFLIPGLWDMHVHAVWPRIAEAFMPLFVANGVTGVREMFGTTALVDSARAAVRAGRYAGPRVVGAGNLVDGSPPVWPNSVLARTPDEGRRVVDSLRAAGADFIKVYSRLRRDVYFAIADEARKRGIPFAGHVPQRVTVAEASDAGQRTMEHLYGMGAGCSAQEAQWLREVEAAVASPRAWDSVVALGRTRAHEVVAAYDEAKCRALLQRLARNGSWQVPTLTVLRNVASLDDTTYALDPRLAYLPRQFGARWNPKNDFRTRMLTPEDYARRRVTLRASFAVVGAMQRAGVPLLAGTDALNPYVFPGFSLHDELALLVEAGLTPAQALRAATYAPAQFLGATDSLGTVAPGKLADLVLLDADPLAAVRNTTRIAAVVANGRLYDRAALDSLLAAAKGK